MTGHRVVTAPELARPSGYSHAVVATGNRMVYLAGQTAQLRDGSIGGADLVEQFDIAATNLIAVLRAAGAGPEHLASLQVFVTDVDEYRASRVRLRAVWRRHFGDFYPAMALLGVRELFDPAARVELMGVAVVP
ncbi:MAG TPA: RidA family protein [Candidatus Dormibacteraeota bacterium]